MKITDVNQYKTATVCVQAGTGKDTTFNAVAVPIYATSTFAFEAPGKTKGYDYSRTANPTRSALEECLAALEGGAGATATPCSSRQWEPRFSRLITRTKNSAGWQSNSSRTS